MPNGLPMWLCTGHQRCRVYTSGGHYKYAICASGRQSAVRGEGLWATNGAEQNGDTKNWSDGACRAKVCAPHRFAVARRCCMESLGVKDITTWAVGLVNADAKRLTVSGASNSAGMLVPPPSALTDAQYLQQLQGEAMGWQPLGSELYMHVGAPDNTEVLYVVGVADPLLGDQNVVILNY